MRKETEHISTGHRLPYSSPEGYFDGLKARLSQIPAEHPHEEEPAVVRLTLWQKLSPYVALAAAFLAIVTVGTVVLRKTAGRQDEFRKIDYIEILAAHDELYLHDNTIFDEGNYSPSSEDIENWLIASNVSCEQLNYLEYEK